MHSPSPIEGEGMPLAEMPLTSLPLLARQGEDGFCVPRGGEVTPCQSARGKERGVEDPSAFSA